MISRSRGDRMKNAADGIPESSVFHIQYNGQQGKILYSIIFFPKVTKQDIDRQNCEAEYRRIFPFCRIVLKTRFGGISAR